MTTITVKIVGAEGDSVLVKYASENSLKPIDEYEAVAYQPKAMGFNTMKEFVDAIKPGLLPLVEQRDAAERSTVDLTSWVDYQSVSNVSAPAQITPVTIPTALDSQVINTSSEVIL